jgi:hypothetical protein
MCFPGWLIKWSLRSAMLGHTHRAHKTASLGPLCAKPPDILLAQCPGLFPLQMVLSCFNVKALWFGMQITRGMCVFEENSQMQT